ncbi:hypothetical protein DSY2206 [Desulfitobacterium hafniense Y51]|uniref:Uncharacterized protein n=1 Tax=Desulfitobacterium hafniense (strain Y51) TaxID=138119 RepID=Q24VE7_DESHY|nr:hypothetical protein DSY2206 [Desulfitobacterium hafniense Y51]
MAVMAWFMMEQCGNHAIPRKLKLIMSTCKLQAAQSGICAILQRLLFQQIFPNGRKSNSFLTVCAVAPAQAVNFFQRCSDMSQHPDSICDFIHYGCVN